jgi:hypothetical protein
MHDTRLKKVPGGVTPHVIPVISDKEDEMGQQPFVKKKTGHSAQLAVLHDFYAVFVSLNQNSNYLPGHTPWSNGVSITYDHRLVRCSRRPVDRRSSIFTILAEHESTPVGMKLGGTYVPTAEAGKRVLDRPWITVTFLTGVPPSLPSVHVLIVGCFGKRKAHK